MGGVDGWRLCGDQGPFWSRGSSDSGKGRSRRLQCFIRCGGCRVAVRLAWACPALPAAVGAAAVAFTSLSSSTQSADDIFRKHQATIDDYKEKMGKATDAVKTFSEEQEEAYKKSLERQRDILNTDIAAPWMV